MLCTVATLDGEKLRTVQSLEKELGKTLLAFSCRDIGVTPLNDDEIARIKRIEEQLGVALVAVK
ncbi:MAG: hypothetical protein M1497_13605 [Nitrospirae bacterium]|nr:hypothetical protein [Nitrospirota bacterium]